jgi:hypothetical protein
MMLSFYVSRAFAGRGFFLTSGAHSMGSQVSSIVWR